jgi:hypothetical protein
LTEPSGVYVGNGKVIIYCRNNVGGSIYQITSDDNMATFSSPQLTTIGSNVSGSGNVNIVYATMLGNGKIGIAFTDRYLDSHLYIEAVPDIVFSNPNAYVSAVNAQTLDAYSSINLAGYISIIPLGDGRLFFVDGHPVAGGTVVRGGVWTYTPL